MPKTHPNGKNRGLKPDEDGGESIAIEITINGKRAYHRSATLTGEPDGNPNQVRRYTTDDGNTIMHNRNAGIKPIARKLLED